MNEIPYDVHPEGAFPETLTGPYNGTNIGGIPLLQVLVMPRPKITQLRTRGPIVLYIHWRS